jgi:hypothetical protein
MSLLYQGSTASMSFTGNGGANDTNIVTGLPLFSGWSSTTVSTWIKISSATANSWANNSCSHELLFKYRTIDIRICKTAGQLKLESTHSNGTAFGNRIQSTNSIPVGSWVHLASVHQGSTITQYINGVVAGSGYN